MKECNQHMQPTCDNGACDMCANETTCIYCHDGENCSFATDQSTCDTYDYCKWDGQECVTNCIPGQNVDNSFCGWFPDVQDAPGFQASPAQALGLKNSGGNPPPSNCRMNTTCAQDCFMCQTQTECLASNNSAFGGPQVNDTACGWDPMSSWNPCYPKGHDPGPDCHSQNDQSSCETVGNCEWNVNGNECQPIGPGGPCNTNCTMCGDEWSCGSTPMGCGWNPSGSPPCTQSNCFSLGCSNCGSHDNCMKADGKYRNEGAAGCVWWKFENDTKVCKDRDCETDCTLCVSESACSSSTIGCEWANLTQNPSSNILSIVQGGQCLFQVGGDQACRADCNYCGTSDDCWGSFAGCTWDHGGGQTIDVVLQNNVFTPNTVTLSPGDRISFLNNDSGNHTVTSVITNETPPDSFDLLLGPGSPYGNSYIRDFYNVRNFTVYCSIHGIDVMNMTIYVVPRNASTSLCTPNNCKQDCGACGDPGACDSSYAGCFWDMKDGQCRNKGWGQSCTTDCWFCENELKCNASNATMWTPVGQLNGCQWAYDLMDGAQACRPLGLNFDCSTMCEQCNATQCDSATPTMLPPDSPGCKWFPNEMTPKGTPGACHPEGHSGQGSGCAQWDFTSKSECEAQGGCVWVDVDRICNPDMSKMTCNERCDLCGNKSACDERSPKCIWDLGGDQTLNTTDDFCREDHDGGFKYGGNCQDNCHDCFDNKSCSESNSACRWVKDDWAVQGYRCDWADMHVCAEDCFACWNQDECGTSTNSRMYTKTVEECAKEENGTECDGNSFCTWNGTACISAVAQTCEWDTQDHFCKPTGFASEICFIPGDEDNDGKPDCKDEECSFNPMCMSGSEGGGPMGMDRDCWIWDEMQGGNISVCECGNSTRDQNGTCTDQGAVVNGTGCIWHTVPKPYPENGTEGLCDPKYNDEVFKGMGEDAPFMILHDPCFPDEQTWVNIEKDVLENKSWLDICDIGIREMENTTAFILNLRDVDDLALCNFLNTNSQNESGKYYFLLDTDDNTSTGCTIDVNITEMDRSPSNFQYSEAGFEYRLDYIVNHSNGTTLETRTVYKCINGSWGVAQVQVSGKKDKACEHESLYYGIRKSDLGNPTGTIHIVAFTAEITGGFGSPLVAMDRAYHAYYTPNTIDVVPPNCQNDPSACGSGYDPNTGTTLFENCFPGTGDEDKDGKTNCDDEDCLTTIFCSESSNYDASTDKTAPKITSSKVEAGHTMAIVKWTTDEPATGVVEFYGTNDTCELGVQNISQYDDPFFPMDDYMPIHMVPLDANNPDVAYALNTPLVPNTTYYYKMSSCDQAEVYNNATNTTNPNCALTACLNFTTKPECESITNETICNKKGICKWYENSTPKCRKSLCFGFEWRSTTEDPTDFLGGVNFQANIVGTPVNVSPGVQYCTNSSSCNMSLSFSNDMTVISGAKAPWIIEMQRCCVPKQTINLTGALQVANRTNDSLFVGMNSAIWQQLSQIIGCKRVLLHLPGFAQDCSNIGVQHCNETGGNCKNVSMDNATMVFCNASLSIWELAGSDPTLFSSYSKESGIDASAPRISGYSEPFQVQGFSAILSVTSNEDSNVTVNYGECNLTQYALNQECITPLQHALFKNSGYTDWPFQTAVNSTMGKAHILYLNGLTNVTSYFYMVVSQDSSANTRIKDDDDYYYRFTTSAGGISQSNSMVVGWNLISLPLNVV